MLSVTRDTEMERNCVLLCLHCRMKHAMKLVCVNRMVLLVLGLMFAVDATLTAYVGVKLVKKFLLMLSLSVL